jgi:hypothetical protein
MRQVLIIRGYERLAVETMGNHGTNTLVFFLYSSQFGLPAYLASWSGIHETKRRRRVMTKNDTNPQYEYGRAMSDMPSQNILSPK